MVCVVAMEGKSEGCSMKLDPGRSFDSSSASLGVAQDFACGLTPAKRLKFVWLWWKGRVRPEELH